MRDLPRKLRIYLLCVYLAGLSLFLYLAFVGRIYSWTAVIVFGVFTLISASFYVKLPLKGVTSISFAIIFAALLLFGPLSAVIVEVFGTIDVGNIKERTPWYKVVFNASQLTLSAGLAGLVYVYTGGIVLAELRRGFSASDFPFILLPIVLSIVVYQLVNTTLLSIAIGMEEDSPPLHIWLVNEKWGMPSYFAHGFFGVILAHIYTIAGPAGIVLFAAPLFIAHQVFKRYRKLRKVYGGSVMSLVKAVEVKDPYTRGHSDRVAQYLEIVAKQLGWREDKIEKLRFAGYLHDIGKIGIPKKILNKPGTLVDQEYERVKAHTELGVSILREIDFLEDVMPIILCHHEHLDTKGYPKGLAAEQIPEGARILAVADSYDAMTSARAYRGPMPKEEAIAELRRCSGAQFDGKVVEVFIRALEECGEEVGKDQPRRLKEQEVVV